MKAHGHRVFLIMLLMVFFVTAFATVDASAVTVDFQYKLANFSGIVPYLWAKLAADEVRKEVYVYDPRERDIRIFGETGMELFRFGEEGEFASTTDLAVDEEGDIYFLMPRYGNAVIKRCNFRGEPISDIALKGLPEEYARFRPEYMEYNRGKFYFADPEGLFIVVTDREGRFEKGYDILSLFNIDELGERKKEKIKKRYDPAVVNDITGFSVDIKGNMYFTIATFFSAFRLSPDGTLESFGQPGSAAGKFGVVGGIAADDLGNVYVADKLRSAVLIFDRKLNFITEFGYRGPRKDNLIVPVDLVVSRDGRLYVSQAAFQGVSVFNLSRGRTAR